MERERIARGSEAVHQSAMLDDRDHQLLTLLQDDADRSVADLAERVHLGRNVDEVRKIVGQIRREQIQIVRPPRIVNVGQYRSC